MAEEAPRFSPTLAEFADPLAYIASIRQEAECFGLCSIRPPAGWECPLALQPAFRFPARVQTVTELQQRLRSARATEWQAAYAAFQASVGNKPVPAPAWGGVTLDLWALSDAVCRRGGYLRVCEDQRWREVVRSLQAASPGLQAGPSASFSLRTVYEKHLLQFELFTFEEPVAPLPARERAGGCTETAAQTEELASQALLELGSHHAAEKLEAEEPSVEIDEARRATQGH